ncbi:16S rRNA methyltransferase [Bifidobacterium hapali]|uniref:Ribosomal RNA small subunit methyltransferase E n=2 Tax=Bifidobacterium hapali TaxID=1630172 RepID=A0A261FYR8_9BIFI|nr:16S rRNA methyltransferase [Bifidobacterium hapali]
MLFGVSQVFATMYESLQGLCSLVFMTNPLFLLDPERDDVPVNSDELNTGWKITLPASVKRHAIQAMRLSDGDELDLSDGAGLRVRAVIADATAGVAEVREVGREPQPVAKLALIQALAKTGHDEQAIDAATQIGVDQVIPWQADRSIAKWKDGRTDRKWHQTLAAATEQSRRTWMPELSDCITSRQMVAICRRACVHGDLVVVLHQDATDTWDGIETLARNLADQCFDDGRSRTINVVVGPEGGISDDEITAFRDAGAHVCVLGTTILRASLAGPVALTLLSRALGRM